MQNYKNKVDNRDKIRLSEEAMEGRRRKQVSDGQWTEAESYTKLQDELNNLHKKFPTERSVEIEVDS